MRIPDRPVVPSPNLPQPGATNGLSNMKGPVRGISEGRETLASDASTTTAVPLTRSVRDTALPRDEGGLAQRADDGEDAGTREGARSDQGRLDDALKALNETTRIFDRRLQFEIHETTHRVLVRVIDAETNQVIREIPPEKILDMLGKMWQMIGLLIDERA